MRFGRKVVINIELDDIGSSPQTNIPPMSSRAPNEEPNKHKKALTNLLVFLLGIGYYGLIIPFKIVRLDDGNFAIKRILFQRILCAFVHLLVLIQQFTYVRSSVPETTDISKFATTYVDFFFFVTNFLFVLSVIKSFWWDDDKYLELVQRVQKWETLPTRTSWVGQFTRHMAVALLLINFAVKMGCNFGLGYEVIFPLSNWSPGFYFRRLVAIARYNFVLSSTLTISGAPEWHEISVLDGFLAVLTGIGKYGGYTLFEIIVVLMFLNAFQLQAIIRGFRQQVKEERNIIGEQWPKFRAEFKAIKKLSQLTNSVMGLPLLIYLFMTALGYSIFLNTIFVSSSIYGKILVINSIVLTISTVCSSANLNKAIDELKDYVRDARYNGNVPDNEASHVLEETGVGIRPAGIFPLTYPFLGLYVATTLPIFLACVLDLKSRML